MSSAIRESGRALAEATCHGIVRRMVSLPRSIIGGVSRVMGHGIDLMGIGGRRNQHLLQPNFQLPHPQQPEMVPEEWAFLTSFEQQYGSSHPFFYVCRFTDALKMAEDDHKFLFMYLHSPQHPFTYSFCNRGEGLHMAATLRPGSFPFCAVVAPASGDSLAVLQQIEGPINPAELVEILQRTMEEQGLAFGSSSRAVEEEKRRADRRLREEQDAAYLAALQIDEEKSRPKDLRSEQVVQKKPVQAAKHNPSKKQTGKKVKEATTVTETPHNETANEEKDSRVTQILIRFPNGERREHSFSVMDKVQSVYRYIDSLGLPGVGNYRLISSFPRRVYSVEEMGMTLKDACLHPRASLFLELL
ncbi:Plant UBX domain-containing protein 10 [Vitis vinifera]|uniref:Plant UBX domain-containing protein 10 n=1 Tax=Vitis vinifera TaxID=29760 RepID=A0A438EYZ6_VITVI|nr:Plant UBX domain-containing protein 10 [Vitis vinifera]